MTLIGPPVTDVQFLHVASSPFIKALAPWLSVMGSWPLDRHLPSLSPHVAGLWNKALSFTTSLPLYCLLSIEQEDCHFRLQPERLGIKIWTSVQSVSSIAQSCPNLCDPMNGRTPGLPIHHQLPESTQTHVHWVSDAIQPSDPLSSPSSPALNLSQHQGLFQRDLDLTFCKTTKAPS